jgi:flavodoxin
MMKSLLILFSYHHRNTEKIANVFEKILDAQVISPIDVDPGELLGYDLVGFGSGIYDGRHHKVLLDLADKLPQVNGRKAFIFSTSALTGKSKVTRDHAPLREKLESTGYIIVNEFNCPGWDTNSDYDSGVILAAVSAAVKLIGGLNKGRPNAQDLRDAEEFARNLKNPLSVIKVETR